MNEGKMTKRNRLILIIIFLVIFLAIAPELVFYALGYKFDFANKKFVSTGGIYIKILTPNAQVFVDGKLKKNFSIFDNSILIQGLLPKKYEFSVKKDGYYSWQKHLEIKEKEVAKVENVTLFKEKLVFSPLIDGVSIFFISPDTKKIISVIKNEKEEDLTLFDVRTKSQKKILSLSPNAKLLDLKWSDDSSKVLFKTLILQSFSEKNLGGLTDKKSEGRIAYYISETTNTIQTGLTPVAFLDKDSKDVSFSPDNSQEIFFIKEDTLFVLRGGEPVPVLNNVVTYEVSPNNIMWLSNSGDLNRSALYNETYKKGTEILNTTPFKNEKNKSYKLITYSNIIFLQEDNTLYFFNQKSRVFERFGENIKNIRPAPTSSKLVYFNDYEIWFSDLGKPLIEKSFLTRFSEKIRDCFWLNDYYLVFVVGDKIKISEIDARDKLNIVDLNPLSEKITEIKNPSVFWDQINKKLYLLNNNSLFLSEKLIP